MVDTPFEARGTTAPWTTLAEEAAWLPTLLTACPNITHEVIGSSGGGGTMYMLTLGTGPRHIMFVAQQHGAELSGRDALFTRIRDWAESSDPDVVDWLTEVTVHVIPSAHPDNHTTRFNPQGIDVGRDHIALTSPEARAIQGAIRDVDPEMVIDLHEGQDITQDFATSPVLNHAAATGVLSVSEDLHLAVKAAIEGAGWTWQIYRWGNTIAPQNLTNQSGLSNRVALLCETARTAGDNTDAQDRWSMMLTAIDACVAWHRANAATVTATVAAAKVETAANTDPITLMDNESTSGPVVDPLPLAYQLTSEDHAAIEVHRELLGISSQQAGWGYAVPLAQASQALLVYLLDPESPFTPVSATRVWEIDPPPTPGVDDLNAWFKVGGEVHEVIAAYYRKGGVTRPLTQLSFRPF